MSRPWAYGCPHCGETEELAETVKSTRRHGVTFDSRGQARFQDDLGEIHSEVLGYWCFSCGKDFNRPRRYYGELEIYWAVERGHWECPTNGCGEVRSAIRAPGAGPLCNGTSLRGHPPTPMQWHSPYRRTRRYMDWGEFTMDLRQRGIDFSKLNRLEVNGKAMFTHENPASEVQTP